MYPEPVQAVESIASKGRGGHREDTTTSNLAILDGRKAAILRIVVSEYISTAQPVSSSHVTKVSGIDVSPATVRSEMVALEAEGYLIQPHTSAGRIPTDKGYRFFVDSLVSPVELEMREQRAVESFFASAYGELERMLEDASRLLARLTDCAAVVTGPMAQGAEIRSVQLVPMGLRVLLVVVVLSNGLVEKGPIEVDLDVSDELCAIASSYLSARLKGCQISSLKNRVEELDVQGPAQEIDAEARLLVAAAQGFLLQASAVGDPEPVYVEGASRMVPAFRALDTVQSVLETLEEHCVVTSLFRQLMADGEPVAIAIGGQEHGMKTLADCTVVVAAYDTLGGEHGTVGLLGPTRMDYRLALAAVAAVGAGIARRLAVM